MTEKETALRLAKRGLYQAEESRRQRQRELQKQVTELEAKIEGQLNAEFADQIVTAKNAVAEAQLAVDTERVEMAGSIAPVPIGTILYRWKDAAGRWASARDWQRTTDTAVVEIFTADSPWPSNQVFNKPEIGDVVVRPMKKDGTRAAKCLLFGNWDARCWCADGERPGDREARQEKREIEL